MKLSCSFVCHLLICFVTDNLLLTSEVLMATRLTMLCLRVVIPRTVVDRYHNLSVTYYFSVIT
jgi:hypothetical protein